MYANRGTQTVHAHAAPHTVTHTTPPHAHTHTTPPHAHTHTHTLVHGHKGEHCWDPGRAEIAKMALVPGMPLIR